MEVDRLSGDVQLHIKIRKVRVVALLHEDPAVSERIVGQDRVPITKVPPIVVGAC